MPENTCLVLLVEAEFRKLIVQYVNAEHAAQFESEGYFILESVINASLMETLESSCDVLIQLMHDEMDRLGTDHIHICLLYTSPSPRD